MNRCTCGHTATQHGIITGRCRACTKCEVPGRDPHAMQQCECTTYEERELAPQQCADIIELDRTPTRSPR